jgi:hypothetical protein
MDKDEAFRSSRLQSYRSGMVSLEDQLKAKHQLLQSLNQFQEYKRVEEDIVADARGIVKPSQVRACKAACKEKAEASRRRKLLANRSVPLLSSSTKQRLPRQNGDGSSSGLALQLAMGQTPVKKRSPQLSPKLPPVGIKGINAIN